MRARVAALIALAVLLASCGVLQPTPAYFRPPLPDPEPMPGLRADEVAAGLVQRGLDCHFGPPSDIGGGWRCQRGQNDEENDFGIGYSSDEEGPIGEASASQRVFEPNQAPEPAALDQAVLANFYLFVEVVVPEDVRPTEAELLNGIQRNYPMELGDGWFIGFDRSSRHRNIRIVYATPDD